MTQDKRTFITEYMDEDNLNDLADVRWAKKRKTIQEWFTNS